MTQVEGFDDFVVAASPRLLGSARLICGDRQIAEDLVQETLIRVCLHWSAIRDPASVTAYAYRTLVRLARRSARRLYHSREIPAGGDRELDRAGPAALSDDLADVDGAFATVRARLRRCRRGNVRRSSFATSRISASRPRQRSCSAAPAP